MTLRDTTQLKNIEICQGFGAGQIWHGSGSRKLLNGSGSGRLLMYVMISSNE